MAILLLVCLSLCIEVSQSQLLGLRDPCMNSTQCRSKCCYRASPRGTGECVPNSQHGPCYGPNNGDRCYYSNECNSGCCNYYTNKKPATWIERSLGNCVGREDGDLCFSSEDCNSGCCATQFNTVDDAVCTSQLTQTSACLGSDIGNFCVLSALCKTGCCRIPFISAVVYVGQCTPNEEEGNFCQPSLSPTLNRYCTCDSGLACVPSKSFKRLKTCRNLSRANDECEI